MKSEDGSLKTEVACLGMRSVTREVGSRGQRATGISNIEYRTTNIEGGKAARV
jgi:hypothetical protein